MRTFDEFYCRKDIIPLLLDFGSATKIRPKTMALHLSELAALLFLLLLHQCEAGPSSRPFIPYRTNAYDQESFVHHTIDWQPDPRRSQVHAFNAVPEQLCPLQFSLGMSKRPHSGTGPAFSIRHPPVIHTVFPARGPGHRQVVYTTQYEHLDVLTPAFLETTHTTTMTSQQQQQSIKEALLQASDFPLLLEGSSFHTSPILHDVNGDGIVDAIVADYDGGVTILGLLQDKSRGSSERRYLHHAQVPRLYLRREWMQARVQEAAAEQQQQHTGGAEDAKDAPNDPYHSYFEYYYNNAPNAQKEDLMRGVTVHTIDQDHEDTKALEQRRSRRVQHDQRAVDETTEHHHRRRLLEEEEEVVVVVRAEETKLREEDVPDNKAEETRKDAVGVETPSEPDKNQQEGSKVVDATEKPPVKENVGTEPHQETQNDAPEDTARDTAEEQLTNIPEDAAQNEENRNVDVSQTEHAVVQEEPDTINARMADPGDDIVRPHDDYVPYKDDAGLEEEYGDDYYNGRRSGDDYAADDPEYGRRYDGEYDDYYGYDYNEAHEQYYDPQHYIRIPPHILCDPVLVEIPKAYGDKDEVDDVLFLAVSYYLDEDEYQGYFSYKRFEETDRGDETEERRGSYVASALMAYMVGEAPRWGSQNHLDLSSDFSAPENVTIVGTMPMHADTTRMGAFALATPTVADLDGDGSQEVLIGTSLGMVYLFDARQLYKRDNWPVQMKGPVESRILVEDVQGDTNLEVFVSDILGNIVCLSHDANVIWQRNIPESLDLAQTQIAASSPLTLGDVNGDGVLDLVTTVQIGQRAFVFAFNAANGKDLDLFPIELDKVLDDDEAGGVLHEKLAQPLLIDLHGDRSLLTDFIRRNGTTWSPTVKTHSQSKPPHGGHGIGLHVVQPLKDKLYIIEATTGCTQLVSIGDKVASMVQADDVHGTGRTDLVVATEEGKIVTLESASPWHALNTWTHGEMRGRENAHSHGYSASQGIFVHDSSRQLNNILGVYVPVRFEIFDNRPNIQREPDKRVYKVEIRDGTSAKRTLWRKQYQEPGVYTERIYIRFGPGYYSLSVVLRTTHGLVYEDTFQVRYNINFLDGFGVLLWLPLVLASTAILFCGAKKTNWDDEEFDGGREGSSLGILGRALPT